MSERITKTRLKNLVYNINAILDRPQDAYTRDSSGKLQPQVGCLVLDKNICGYQVEAMLECGGVTIILERGTAKETYYGLKGMLAGIQLTKGRK